MCAPRAEARCPSVSRRSSCVLYDDSARLVTAPQNGSRSGQLPRQQVHYILSLSLRRRGTAACQRIRGRLRRESSQPTSSMISTSSSKRYPWCRAKSTSSFARWTTAPRSGVPVTEMPRPRRNSSSPSSRSSRRERSTVFVLTPRTAARSFAGGRRSPGFASPSAIARRISPATCSYRSVGSVRSTLTSSMVLVTIA